MAIHYNAFISYRHHPEDVKVAVDIHRGLERFKIPKALKRQGKTIDRIFRDKEELTITSCLTDTITQALENSDFLIVICSPHTRDSVWVQREIETFLRHHTRDHVLTVLAGGEPFDVIPDILLYEDVVNPITGLVERHEFEPLSCDWRLKKRKAVQEELPRLAAALLDCGYDELRQRQRQYRMRRMVTFFSLALAASLCLTAYFIRTSIQIQKANDDLSVANDQIQQANADLQDANVAIQNNLDQALRNQSEYLASSSGELLEGGDRLAAVALAMAALPGEGNDRPYVPLAEAALSKALYAYHPEPAVGAKATFEAGAQIQQFFLSPDAMTLYILDDRDMVTIWDTQTYEKIGSLDASGFGSTLFRSTPQGNVLLYGYLPQGGNGVVCFRPDGQQLWLMENLQDAAFLDGGSTLLLIHYDVTAGYQLLFTDPDTGALQKTLPIPSEAGERPSGFCQEDNNADRPLPIKFTHGDFSQVRCLDLTTDTFTLVTQMNTGFDSDQRLETVYTADNGDTLLLLGDDSGMMNGNYGSFVLTSLAKYRLVCFDTATQTEKWSAQINTHLFSGIQQIRSVPGSDWILCMVGNTFQLHDGATGEVLQVCQTPAMPKTFGLDESQVFGILESGAYYSIAYDDFQCYASPFTTNDLSSAAVGKGYYVHFPLTTQVVKYHLVSDGNTEEAATLSHSVSAKLSQGNYLALVGSKNLSLVDMLNNKLLWTAAMSSYSPELLGFSPDGSRIWVLDNGSALGLDCVTGEQTGAYPLTQILPDGATAHQDSPAFYSQENLFYTLEADGQLLLRRLALTTGSETDWALSQLAPQQQNYSKDTRIVLNSDTQIWFQREGILYALELQTGALSTVEETLSGNVYANWSADGALASLYADQTILLVTPQGNIRQRITLEGVKAVSTFFFRQELLVLCDDGSLLRYDLGGQLLGKVFLQIYENFSRSISSIDRDPMAVGWWVTPDGELVLNALSAGNLIDTENWCHRAFIPYLCSYCSQSDRLVSSSGKSYYSFPRYTTQALMAEAALQLGAYQLSESQKTFYGID